MTDEQKAALGDNVQVDQVDKTISSAYELKDEIDSHDVIAVVAPINLQAQFISIAGEDKPVISAVSDRILVPDPDGGESKVEFQFNKWEQLDKIEVVKHDYEPADKVDRDEDEHELTAADDAKDDAAVEEENPDIDANGDALDENENAVDADDGNVIEDSASDDIQDANDNLETDTTDAASDYLNDDANDMEDVPYDNCNDSFDAENNSDDVDTDLNDVDNDSDDNVGDDRDYWDSGDSVD